MGGTKQYLSSGGFSEQTYKQIGTTSNGIKILGKVKGNNSATPGRSNTPFTQYAALDSKNGSLKQISFYGRENGRQKIKDIDFGHSHDNIINGKIVKSFKDNEIHVQVYDKHGIRSSIARKPSRKERRVFYTALSGR